MIAYAFVKNIQHLNILVLKFEKVHFQTCLYNFDPLKPHFYIVKLGFTGVYIIFLTSTHNLCFEQKYEKYQNLLSENFHFLVVNFSVYLNRHVFVMLQTTDLSKSCWKSGRL